MFGLKIQKESKVEKAGKKLTSILDFAVNHKASSIVRKLDTMDLVTLYENQNGSKNPIQNLIQIVVINELNNRYPRAVKIWLEHTQLHLRQVITMDIRMKEKEALEHGRQETAADLAAVRGEEPPKSGEQQPEQTEQS